MCAFCFLDHIREKAGTLRPKYISLRKYKKEEINLKGSFSFSNRNPVCLKQMHFLEETKELIYRHEYCWKKIDLFDPKNGSRVKYFS